MRLYSINCSNCGVSVYVQGDSKGEAITTLRTEADWRLVITKKREYLMFCEYCQKEWMQMVVSDSVVTID